MCNAECLMQRHRGHLGHLEDYQKEISVYCSRIPVTCLFLFTSSTPLMIPLRFVHLA